MKAKLSLDESFMLMHNRVKTLKQFLRDYYIRSATALPTTNLSALREDIEARSDLLVKTAQDLRDAVAMCIERDVAYEEGRSSDVPVGTRYRKRPIIIEAEQFFPDKLPWPDGVTVDPSPHVTGSWWIGTLEGGHVVLPGDWIITGVKGEKYPCKPDIFEATYDIVETEE